MPGAVAVIVGEMVEFDDQGIPWRGSGTEGSCFYFWDPNLIVAINGRIPECCIEFDRRNGWIRCRLPDGTSRRDFGTVTARYRPMA